MMNITNNRSAAVSFVGLSVLLLILFQLVSVANSFSIPSSSTTVARGWSTSSTATSSSLYGKPEGMSDEDYENKMEKATKAMTAFSNKYLKNTCTTLCSDKSVPAVVIKGLAEHKGASNKTNIANLHIFQTRRRYCDDNHSNIPSKNL